MQPASTALTLAASPSALTLTALRDALAAEAAFRAAVDASRPTRLAANAARDLALEHKRRKSLLAASDAAEALANATAEAVGYDAKKDRATQAHATLARCLYADRVRALALGDLWTGAGYCDVLADAIADRKRDGAFAGSFASLADETDGARVDVHVRWDGWQGEATALTCRAHLADTRRDGSPCVRCLEVADVRMPEARGYGDKARRAVDVGMTGTRINAADMAAVSLAFNTAEALVNLAERYAAAYPERTPREDAAALVAAGGVWRSPEDAPEVLRGVDPRA
jgi:hypothetical protein